MATTNQTVIILTTAPADLDMWRSRQLRIQDASGDRPLRRVLVQVKDRARQLAHYEGYTSWVLETVAQVRLR